MEPCPIDHNRINEFTGGDPEQFKELMDLYLDQAGIQIVELKAAIQNKDEKMISHLAHKCAGSSATCGMVLISPILRDLECKARDGDLKDASSLYEQITLEFEKIREYLRTYTPSSGAS